jgi:menaquinol-cytochrome c reductase iron-sulfur subunit
MPHSHHMNRNNFVKVVIGFLGSIMGAIIGIPSIGYLISPALKKQENEATIPLGSLEDYPIGTPTPFTFTRTNINGWERTVNSYGVYVLRKSGAEGDVIAFSNICTHLSCRVTWNEEKQQYICPCHAGFFDINGEVISGPPPRPLNQYSTQVEAGNLSLLFKEG